MILDSIFLGVPQLEGTLVFASLTKNRISWLGMASEALSYCFFAFYYVQPGHRYGALAYCGVLF
jgi:hypothetical protein